VADELGLPALPSDCRRGSCLTCSAVHSSDSQTDSLRRLGDGLSPTVSGVVEKRDYVLTCSSTLVADGTHLILGEHDLVWDDVWRRQLEDEETKQVGREAAARAMRMNAERHLDEWAKETEESLQKSGEQSEY